MSTCRSCGAPIVWAATEHGKAIPLQPDPAGLIVIRSNLALVVGGTVEPRDGEPRYTTHFATCPDADTWRQR